MGTDDRREQLRFALDEHGLAMGARALSETILARTGGPPALLTGATYVAPWRVYDDLRAMEAQGLVSRVHESPRRVLWQLVAPSG